MEINIIRKNNFLKYIYRTKLIISECIAFEIKLKYGSNFIHYFYVIGLLKILDKKYKYFISRVIMQYDHK